MTARTRQGRTSAEWAAKRQRILQRDGSACHYCGRDLVDAEVTLDHVFPKSMGGSSADRNLVVACQTCNSRLGDALDKCPCAFCREVRLSRPWRRTAKPRRTHAQAYPIANLISRRTRAEIEESIS